MTRDYYILNGHRAVKSSLIGWAQWLEDNSDEDVRRPSSVATRAEGLRARGPAKLNLTPTPTLTRTPTPTDPRRRERSA